MPPRLSRRRLVTGAVTGMKLRILANVPSGVSIRTATNHRGAMAGRITKAAMFPAAREFVVTAPIAACNEPRNA